MTVVLSRRARKDLHDAYAWITQDSPAAADRMLARIANVVDLLAAGDIAGPTVHLRDGRQVQAWSVPPFRIYYRKSATRFQVVRVYHHSRQPIER